MISRLLTVSIVTALLGSCVTPPSPMIKRNTLLHKHPATADIPTTQLPDAVETATVPLPDTTETPNALLSDAGGPLPVIRRGNGEVINQTVAATPPPSMGVAGKGSAIFNFEGESLQAVVKAILGDMLGQNYFIASGVQGTVTLSTPKPVSSAQALSLLEMVLGWNNARMIYNNGRYSIVQADQALAGTVAPSTAPSAVARGFEVRVVPLKYISASEMKKVLDPYARPNAIVSIDTTRNLITLAGTRVELENYLRTVQIFDVDWLSGMSVGVFPIQSGKADKVAADLEKVFGESGKTPSAGMFRFMPLESANAVLVITPQASYLDQIQKWLDSVDSVGGALSLFSYALKYIKANDLANRLAEVFGVGARREDSNVSLAPGAQLGVLGSGGSGDNLPSAGGGGSLSAVPSNGGADNTSSANGGLGGSTLQLSPRTQGNGSVTLHVQGDTVGVSAVEEINTLLVRATPQAWKSIRDVIEKLDVMPMQVHIEAQVAEVSLTNQLSYGVNWFFQNSVNAAADAADNGASNGTGIGLGAGLPSAAARSGWKSIAGKVTSNGLAWTFLGKNAAAIINALDQVTQVRLLQTPSVFVRNNAEATLNVGARIPINSTSINTGLGSNSTYSSVQYIDTGVILKVRPRVTKDGMVFLDIVQEVSTPGSLPAACSSASSTLVNSAACNVQINTRRIKTEAAVQSGDTIMLAGLIDSNSGKGSNGVPFLSKVPIVGGLFGTKAQNNNRREIIVLLTPEIVRNPQEARNLTDEYSQKFNAMEPLPGLNTK
ncbi:type II secretion system secretin GspD [Xylella fastidiosa subsp. morus]|uniref:type II secretion system secretin GspD n=1 Tax=Xylella fastidiosa TaxID=2371 RepID=UPI00056FFE31|nr:type II secretion system secretin GspD [Xylella fastidiosa]MDD0910067.1 type II secretion system secretin GspD [Xylella fastidiosa subsp. multiplex]MDS9989555.1 type II secretion system secretin GspD [Xylella fastidiosa]UIT35897.1 type II secretion system secretin GspD [Xylella fastidiosa subsp. morus]UIT38189.1 type II secretion system secretin GspD [Xylella fastidiosa subsp. morus]UIT48586.1 type II secretion system secretin GspD [Xylella fastidiosa subsp. multiplex]